MKIYDGSTLLGQTVADANGNWSYTPTTPLGEGLHNLSASVTTGDVEGAKTAVFELSVDLTPPVAPTILTVIDDVGTVTGAVTDGATIDDNKPQFKGKAEANSTVVIYDGTAEIGRVNANASGEWSFTPPEALGNGSHSISAKAVDTAGNVSASSGIFNFNLMVFDLFEDFNSDELQTFKKIGDSLDSGVFTINQLKNAVDWTSTGIVKSGHDQSKVWGIHGGSAQATLNNGIQASAIKFQMRDNQDPIGPTISFYDKIGNLIFNEKFKADFDGQFEFKMPGGLLFSSFVVTPGKAPGYSWDYVELDNISVAVVTTGDSQLAADQTLVDRAESESLKDSEALAHSIHGSDALDHSTQSYTAGDDTLIAKLGFADRLEGGAGNDTFTQVGTSDVVHGGEGDDTVRINSGDFERIDGGLGIDTLVMDGKSMHIDLSALGLKVQGFEKFDLGAGGNTLALHASDVLTGGVRDMVTADGKVQMLVNGANGDVDLLGGNDSWTQGSNTTVSGVNYSVYTNLAGTAELLVEDKVHVTIM